MALANQAVLHVACGFWHTACVARAHQQQQPSQLIEGAVNYLGDSVNSSASFEDGGIGMLSESTCTMQALLPNTTRLTFKHAYGIMLQSTESAAN